MYRDAESKEIRYVDADVDGRFAVPEGVSAISIQELRFAGKTLGTDYGPVKSWLAAIGASGVTAGDLPESLRLQVAVDRDKYPSLSNFINDGTGQVNPLLWDDFRSAALAANLPMKVSSNGLGNYYQQARDNITVLSSRDDAVWLNVYNPTIDGRFVRDTFAEAVPANLAKQNQAAQVAIESTLRDALGYNVDLDRKNGRDAGTTSTVFLGHSQGTINGNLAISRMRVDEVGRLAVVNVGTASWWVPEGLRSFDNIVDKGDMVTNWTFGRGISKTDYALERPGTYRLWPTDMSSGSEVLKKARGQF